jgi:hypothetical protein
MASATKIPINDFNVNLILTKDESEFLLTVLNHIGGCPKNSKRKFSDSIIKSLESINITVDKNYLNLKPGKDEMYFLNETN